MTRPSPVNMAHSVHDRLLELAKKKGRPFNELLQYYAMERFLYRLAKSSVRRHFVLKGALLLSACADAPYRPTRDIDLLGHTGNTEANIRDLIQKVCRQKVSDDGLRFDHDSVITKRIKEDADYAGVRAQFIGYLGNALLPMQVDVGFGDVVTPAPQEIKYPVLLDQPAPRLRAYPIETAVAEKVQAMVYLGELNSRMKDFYDVWILCRHVSLDHKRLCAAIQATFAKRKTAITPEPVFFTPAFAEAKQVQWRAFLRKLRMDNVPDTLGVIIRDIRSVLEIILAEARQP